MELKPTKLGYSNQKLFFLANLPLSCIWDIFKHQSSCTATKFLQRPRFQFQKCIKMHLKLGVLTHKQPTRCCIHKPWNASTSTAQFVSDSWVSCYQSNPRT